MDHISRNQKGVNRFLYYFIISGIAMPINNVALMKVMQAFHLVNTRIGIILLYAAINIPLSLFLAYGFVATIPREIDEAAVIDGAGKGQVFANITLPSIMSVIKTVTLTAIIGNFQMFTLFYNMTAGGPVRATTTLTVYTYETAFMSYDLGKGAAIGVVWMIFLIGFGTLYNRRLSRTEFYG